MSDEALQRHYVFVTEYLWGVVEPEFDTGQAVTILDVKGLKMRDLAGEALAFVQVRPCLGSASSTACRLPRAIWAFASSTAAQAGTNPPSGAIISPLGESKLTVSTSFPLLNILLASTHPRGLMTLLDNAGS